MFDDPQLDVDEEPSGPQYKIGDLVLTCDHEIMVVEDIDIATDSTVIILREGEKDDPKNYDYLLMDKECNEYWYSHAQIEHKANHMKDVYYG